MWQWLACAYWLIKDFDFSSWFGSEFDATEAGKNLPESSENSLYKHHAKMPKILGNLRVLT
jgi:hypothetical protein